MRSPRGPRPRRCRYRRGQRCGRPRAGVFRRGTTSHECREHDECTALTREPSQRVSAKRITRVNANPDDIAAPRRVEIERLQGFVDDNGIAIAGRGRRGQYIQPARDAYRTDRRLRRPARALRFYVQPVTLILAATSGKATVVAQTPAPEWPRRMPTNGEKTRTARSVLKRTYIGIPICQDTHGRGGSMPKSAVVRHASRRHGRPRPAGLPSLVEGHIAEMCRDLAVEAKRMRQLQEQADELRKVIRQWAAHSGAHSQDDVQLVMEDDAQQ